MTIRQPIVTICGHVDHGKTSILDRLRQSCVQSGEAGGITQKISFTLYPISKLKQACPLIESSGIKLNIPGFLLIDTPGHAAFTNLRKRGGSLADLAVLVIDINEGIKPQTAEVISILKHNKTPFLIALNKIDNISGWRSPSGEEIDEQSEGHKSSGGGSRTDKNLGLRDSIETQPENVKQLFDERYMTLIGSLNSYGFDADLYYNIEDFSKKLALIPTSARTNQGIPELIMMLCGLSEKYLTNKLTLGKDARGVILEVKKDKSMSLSEAILYDGELNKSDEIIVGTLEGEPIITKIRILEEIQPLCSKFKPKDKVQASTGLRMQLIEKAEILPGMPFEIYKNNLNEVKERFKKEISENIATQNNGIIAKADSLGSLEALLILLKQSNVPVLKAGIGDINKKDIISAKANLDINELDAIIVGFNSKLDEDAKELAKQEKIKVITDEVIYKLIENLEKFRKEKAQEIEKLRMMELATICKLEILHQYVFRNSNPAVFGIRVLSGTLRKEIPLIDETGEKIARVKNIEENKKTTDEVITGKEVAISLPGTNFERALKERKFLYSDMSEFQFRQFKKNKDLLTQGEMKTLQEIAEMKRKTHSEWGM